MLFHGATEHPLRLICTLPRFQRRPPFITPSPSSATRAQRQQSLPIKRPTGTPARNPFLKSTLTRGERHTSATENRQGPQAPSGAGHEWVWVWWCRADVAGWAGPGVPAVAAAGRRPLSWPGLPRPPFLPSWGRCASGTRSRGHSRSGTGSSPPRGPARGPLPGWGGGRGCAPAGGCLHLGNDISEREEAERQRHGTLTADATEAEPFSGGPAGPSAATWQDPHPSRTSCTFSQGLFAVCWPGLPSQKPLQRKQEATAASRASYGSGLLSQLFLTPLWDRQKNLTDSRVRPVTEFLPAMDVGEVEKGRGRWIYTLPLT